MAQITRYELWGGFGSAVACPEVERAIMTVMEGMPEEDFDALEDAGLIIRYAGASSPEPMFCPPHDKEIHWWLLILVSDIQGQPYDCIVGEVAHELAHVVLLDEYGTTTETSEFDACAKAIQWGFGKEMLARLYRMKSQRLEGTAGDSGPEWDYCISHMDELEALAEQAADKD